MAAKRMLGSDPANTQLFPPGERSLIMSGRDALVMIDFLPALEFDGAEALCERLNARAQAISELLGRARRKSVPVVWVNDNRERWDITLADLVREAEDGPLAALLSRVRPDAGEACLLKPRHSGFYQTPLAFLLERLGVDRVVLVGAQANICVLFTAHDAHVRQFDVLVPRDGVASVRPAHEQAALEVVRSFAGDEATPACAEVVWRTGRTP